MKKNEWINTKLQTFFPTCIPALCLHLVVIWLVTDSGQLLGTLQSFSPKCLPPWPYPIDTRTHRHRVPWPHYIPVAACQVYSVTALFQHTLSHPTVSILSCAMKSHCLFGWSFFNVAVPAYWVFESQTLLLLSCYCDWSYYCHYYNFFLLDMSYHVFLVNQ